MDYLSFIDDSSSLDLTCVNETPSVDVQAEQNESSTPMVKFHINAYTGAAMVPSAWEGAVVIELSGIKQLNKITPIRFNHCNWSGVGHADKVYVKDGVLQADGVFSRDNEYSREIIDSSRKGFPWQASVGGRAIKRTYVEDGATIQANGKSFKGPLTYVSEFELCEISICDLGADSQTSANVVAQAKQSVDNSTQSGLGEVQCDESQDNLNAASSFAESGDEMKKKNPEIQSSGERNLDDVKPDVDESQISATPNAEDENVNATSEPTVDPEPEPIPDAEEPEPETPETDCDKPVAASNAFDEKLQKEIVAERTRNDNRIAAINSVECEGFEELRAQAIEEGWSFADFNVALKAARHDKALVEPRDLPKGNVMIKSVASDAAIEASIVADILGSRAAENFYDEKTLNEAYDVRSKLRCFRDVFAYATQSPFYRDDLRDMSQIQAAFSTSALEKIFRNVVNKALLTGYETVSDDWRKICSVSRANDFKPVYNYRIGGDFTYKEISNNANEISNATFSEEEYTNTVKSYALMYTITRKMLYNDDLNALADYPRRLGQGAAETLNDEIYKTLIGNATGSDGNKFFSTAHKNYKVATSAYSTALSIDTLGDATELFETQETAEGRPIAQDARYLFVPTALKTTAQRIINSITVVETTSVNAPAGAANPFYGKYEVVSSPFLQSARYAGSSNANWYLFGDPARISAIDVVFLNGVEKPTIEQGNVSFDQLGIAYRGVFDFGVKLMDWRGGVLFASEA